MPGPVTAEAVPTDQVRAKRGQRAIPYKTRAPKKPQRVALRPDHPHEAADGAGS